MIATLLNELRAAGGSLAVDPASGSLVIHPGRGLSAKLAADLELHRDELEQLLSPPPVVSPAEADRFIDEHGIAPGGAQLLRHAVATFSVAKLELHEEAADGRPKARRGGCFATLIDTEWHDPDGIRLLPAGTVGIVIRRPEEIADRFVRVGIAGDLAAAERRGGGGLLPVWIAGRVRTLAPHEITFDIGDASAIAPTGRPWAVAQEDRHAN